MLTLNICYHILEDRCLFSLLDFFSCHKKRQKQKPCFLLSLCQSCDSKDTVLWGCILSKAACRCGSSVEQWGKEPYFRLVPLTGCVSLDKFLNISEPCFPYLKNENDSIQFPGCVWRRKCVVYVILLIHDAGDTYWTSGNNSCHCCYSFCFAGNLRESPIYHWWSQQN